MNWMNPRKFLPKDGDIIWILCIENREGQGSGELPCAKTTLAQAAVDSYGVTYVEVINHKGFANYTRHFYNWWHFYQDDIAEGEQRYKFFNNRDDEMITAWKPFDGLPDWDYIEAAEAEEIIKEMPSYNKRIEILKNEKKIEKHIERPSFISMQDSLPVSSGVYVVATISGVFLLKYDLSFENKWFAPNGEEVKAWYPIPNSY